MGSRHGDSFWEEEKGNIGLKLMQGMGWKMGAGLGRAGLGSTDVIKIKQRKGMEGIGSEKDAGRDEMWTAATSAYNDLLKRLASGGEASTTPISTAATIQQHKSRQQLYSRFKKSNRSYSEKDREAIFGRRDAVPAFPTFSGMALSAEVQSKNAECNENEECNEKPAMKKPTELKTKSAGELVVKKARRSDSKGSEDNKVKRKRKDEKNDKKEKKKKAKDGDTVLKKSKKQETTVKKKRKRDETEMKKSKTSSKESGTVKKKRKADKGSTKKSKTSS